MKYLLNIIFIFLPLILIAQQRTYLGAEIGPKFDIYQSIDNGNRLSTKPFLFSPIYGLTIEQEINKFLSAELGFYVNDYGEGYRIEGDFGYSTSNAIVALQLPLRLKARIPLAKDKVHLIPMIGYTFAINTSYGSTGSGFSFTTVSGDQFNDSTRAQHISNYSLQETYGLIETGVALEYMFHNAVTVYLAGNYLIGRNRIIELDVTYRINDQPEQTATVFSNGNYFSMLFGLKYPISRLWQKEV